MSQNPIGPPLIVSDIARIVAWVFSKLLWFIKFEGLANIPGPSSRALIIAANHQTYLDPVWLCIPFRRRFRFMAVEKAFGWPAVGPLIKALGAFPVRHPIEENSAVLKRCFRILREGSALVIFPEGIRSDESGNLSEFRPGAARLAIKTGTPVLPVTISGGNHVWPRGRSRPALFRRISVRYHPLIEPGKAETPDILTRKIRSSIERKS